MVDVSEATFEQDVLEKSDEVPVVVDLWADWCGPCKTLGPILERVVGETQGDVVLAKNAADFQACYNLSNVTVLQYGVDTGTNFINSLSRQGTIRLRNNSGGVVLEVKYDHDDPWPVGADGTGHSLVLARPSYGENDPQAAYPV